MTTRRSQVFQNLQAAHQEELAILQRRSVYVITTVASINSGQEVGVDTTFIAQGLQTWAAALKLDLLAANGARIDRSNMALNLALANYCPIRCTLSSAPASVSVPPLVFPPGLPLTTIVAERSVPSNSKMDGVSQVL